MASGSKKSGAAGSTKKRSPSQAAKSSIERTVKNEVKNGVKNEIRKDVRSAVRKKSGAVKALPYLAVFFGLLFLLCLFVDIAGEKASVLFRQGMRGIFGYIGAVVFSVYLIYLGAINCLFGWKWSEANGKSRDNGEFVSNKKKLRMRTALSTVSVILVPVLMGTAARDPAELSVIWENGYENVISGGIVGGFIGSLLSELGALPYILIITALIIMFMFIIGLTPEYIITTVRCRRELRGEEKAAEDEYSEQQIRYERIKKRETDKLQAKKLRDSDGGDGQANAKTAKSKKRVEDDEQPAPLIVVDTQTGEVKEAAEENADGFEELGEVTLRPLTELANETPKRETDKPIDGDIAMDYGGDPVIDGGMSETATVEELLRDIGTDKNADTAHEEHEDIELGVISHEDIAEDMGEVIPEADTEKQDAEEELVMPYVFPPVDMLSPNQNPVDVDCQAELQENARILKETLKSFRVEIKEINYSRGPTITRYELKPEVGTRVRSIANLVDDISLSLATSGVRIEAPIPNKAAVGIEVPNRNRAKVYLRDLIENPKFTEAKSKLTACLGMDVGGNPIYFDISKMPHLLIAGATGMGKSVCINSVITSILYKARPEDVKLILIDPKKVEFNMYKDIPHLYAPIVSEPKKAAGALASAVAEMERRFLLIEEVGVRDIGTYNAATENDPEKEHMPHMVIIIDELADLMMTAPDDVESCICRIAQKARAAGIHLVIGTQRPSVDVITGLIKANVPSRIACTVASQVDSRTIIDIAGAEKLIGYGDMLFAPVGAAKPMRVQGAFVSEGEVEKIVSFIKQNNPVAKYNSEFISNMEANAKICGMSKKEVAAMESSDGGSDGGDSKFRDAVKLAVEEGKISTSLMQRRLGVGYGRAAKIIDTMEQMGYVSKPDGNKPRRVLLTMEEYMNRIADGSIGEE